MRAIVNDLLAHGQARVELAISDIVPDVNGGFGRLLAEDWDYLQFWEPVQRDQKTGKPLVDDRARKIPLLPHDGDVDDLLMIRGFNDGGLDKEGREHDNKVMFHYRKWSMPLLCAMGVDFSRHQDFLNACDELHRRTLRHWIDVCLALDEALPGYDFLGMCGTDPFHVLRLIQYLDVRPGTEVIGKSHTDKSAATYHLWEEHEACEVEGSRLKYIQDQPVLFASDELSNITGGEIRAMNHQVVVRPGLPARRKVIIFFPRLNHRNRIRMQAPAPLELAVAK